MQAYLLTGRTTGAGIDYVEQLDADSFNPSIRAYTALA